MNTCKYYTGMRLKMNTIQTNPDTATPSLSPRLLPWGRRVIVNPIINTRETIIFLPFRFVRFGELAFLMHRSITEAGIARCEEMKCRSHTIKTKHINAFDDVAISFIG